MGRNIVVCCDGTANQFDLNNTNVVKLYSTLVDDAARQLIFYHPGVGTMEAPGALTSWGRKATILAGIAVGYGLERDITAAYTFIMNNYRAGEGDRLFLFGFSRGAYTVRAIASLLRSCGILRPGHETSIPYAIRLMNAIGGKGGAQGRRHLRIFPPRRALPAHFRGRRLQAAFCRRLGHRGLGRLDQQSSQDPLHRQQRRHPDRPSRRRARRATRLLSSQPVASRQGRQRDPARRT